MRHLLLSLVFLFSTNVIQAQFLKEFYEDFLKYGTVYAAGDIQNAYESSRKEYFVERPEDGNIYDIPRVVEVTEYYPFDYRIGFGIRKLGRFDYERKPGNFWTGNQLRERQIALSAPTSAVQGFEYLFHWEKERQRGEIWTNSRYFIRHTGKNHIVKLESREQGAFDFQYNSAEARYRLPIGKKFSISAGAIYRTHNRGYGFNPIEYWLNETETDEFGNEYPVNPWYTLGYQYGYYDKPYEGTYIDPNTGEPSTVYDYYWFDGEENLVAYSDNDFRNTIFRDLMNQYNNEFWDQISSFGVISPIVGFDFYHYDNKFWFHAFGNLLLPAHSYIKVDPDWQELNYGYRNGFGKGGLMEDAEFEQWTDWQAGVNMGWKLSKNFGIFVEGEYTKFWDSRFFYSTFGLNYTFR